MTHADPRVADSPLADERAGLDACVHCGFCLQSCPTYLALEDENDSPRGRVLIMRGLLEVAAVRVERAAALLVLDADDGVTVPPQDALGGRVGVSK